MEIARLNGPRVSSDVKSLEREFKLSQMRNIFVVNDANSLSKAADEVN